MLKYWDAASPRRFVIRWKDGLNSPNAQRKQMCSLHLIACIEKGSGNAFGHSDIEESCALWVGGGGGRRRNSAETECLQRLADVVEFGPIHLSLSWIPKPCAFARWRRRIYSPTALDCPASSEQSTLYHRELPTFSRGKRSRSDNAPSRPISFKWRGNFSSKVSQLADRYLEEVDIGFSFLRVCAVPQLGDNLNLISCDARISARNIQNVNMSRTSGLVAGLKNTDEYNTTSINQAIGYRTRGAIPRYRGSASATPRIRGYPYKRHRSLEIMGKFRRGVRQGRILVFSTNAISGYDHMACPPSTLVAKKPTGRTLPNEMRLISDVRPVGDFCEKEDYPGVATPLRMTYRLEWGIWDEVPHGFPEEAERDMRMPHLKELPLVRILCPFSQWISWERAGFGV